jgi:lipopolysaccharide/colanic/teichoic acid biosynthesis glycosyltransferase
MLKDQGRLKRYSDVSFAYAGLIILFPLFLLVIILIKIDSRGPVFFRQVRIGKNFEPFIIYKFRTMKENVFRRSILLASSQTDKITPLGRILRKTKIDEFPQLINVLKGEMSFVGPRPEVKQYIDMFLDDYAQILTVRPGITDISSIKFRDEMDILTNSCGDQEKEYINIVLPEKISLGKEYIRRSSFIFDSVLILKTIAKVFL